MLDYIKWGLVVLIFCATVAGNYVYMDHSFLFKMLMVIGGSALSMAVAFTTTSGVAAWSIVKASPNELRKVIWPQKNEVLQITIIVIIMVSILMLLVWGIDSALLRLISWITGQGV